MLTDIALLTECSKMHARMRNGADANNILHSADQLRVKNLLNVTT